METTIPGATYDGKLITSKSLLTLMPPFPREGQQELSAWLAKHKAVLTKVCTHGHPYCGAEGSFRKYTQQMIADLKVDGMEAKGSHNITVPFTLSSVKYVARMTGPFHVATNLLKYNGWPEPVNPLPPVFVKDPARECDAAITNAMPTWQGISRATHWLRVHQALTKLRILNFITPATYLIPLEGNPEEVHDDNAIIVQRFEGDENGKSFPLVKDLSQEKIRQFLPDQVRNLLCVIVYAGLWDITGHLRVDPNGNFVDSDLEQPDNSNPADFFHKNQEKMLHNIRCGIQQLKQLMTPNEACCAVCEEFEAMTDPELIAMIAS